MCLSVCLSTGALSSSPCFYNPISLSLQDIPEHLSTGTYVTFKFFYHAKMYSTTRYCGQTTTPMIKSTISIDQKITPDFIECIRTGYVDIEVWGKRGSKANDIENHLSLLSSSELQAASKQPNNASGCGSSSGGGKYSSSSGVDWHHSAIGSSCVILNRVTDYICDIPSDVSKKNAAQTYLYQRYQLCMIVCLSLCPWT